MAGSWDFTVITGKNPHPIAVDAILTQDSRGNISAAGSVTASGPAGNTFQGDMQGSSLSAAADMFVDYLGFTCTGTDSGDRSITGTINSSNQVTLARNIGGTEVATITGTLNSSANPPFSGTMSTSGICGGPGTVNVTGAPASFPPTGTYGGTGAVDNTENIDVEITDTNGTLTGDGGDSKLGDFTVTGNTVGNAFSATLTYSSSPGGNGPVFGYFDAQLGARGGFCWSASRRERQHLSERSAHQRRLVPDSNTGTAVTPRIAYGMTDAISRLYAVDNSYRGRRGHIPLPIPRLNPYTPVLARKAGNPAINQKFLDEAICSLTCRNLVAQFLDGSSTGVLFPRIRASR